MGKFLTLAPGVLEAANEAAGSVWLQRGLEAKIGASGCSAAEFKLMGTGELRGLSSTKEFRVVCDAGVFAVHPDDAGWVLREVELFMPVKPVWMQSSRTFFRAGKWVAIPAGFTFQPTQWTCPDCIPAPIRTSGKVGDIIGYDNAKCDPCNAGNAKDGVHEDRVERFGYDNRVMHPWSLSKQKYGTDFWCAKQPGSANTLCLPRTEASGANTTVGFCNPLDGADRKYRTALWKSAGIAIRNYNAQVLDRAAVANMSARDKAAAKGGAQLSGLGAAPKPNYVPAMVAAALTGVGALLMWGTRRKR